MEELHQSHLILHQYEIDRKFDLTLRESKQIN